MYRRKLAEADAVLARLGAIRADLAGKLADALARQDPGCAPDPCVVPERL